MINLLNLDISAATAVKVPCKKEEIATIGTNKNAAIPFNIFIRPANTPPAGSPASTCLSTSPLCCLLALASCCLNLFMSSARSCLANS